MLTSNVRIDSEAAIYGEHRRLHAHLLRLHEQLAAARLSEDETARDLARAEAELEEHFSHEECGGFFAAIRERSPQFAERAAHLMREHQEMRLLFRSLRMTCRWACGESGYFVRSTSYHSRALAVSPSTTPWM